MKTPLPFLFLALASLMVNAAITAVTHAATPTAADWTGKTVMIKTSHEGSNCIRIDKNGPVVGTSGPGTMDACSFRVMPGKVEGTVAFESVAQPGMYLHHFYFHLVLRKEIDADAMFHIVAPLHGDQGVSFQSLNYPDRHLMQVDKNLVDLVAGIKQPAKAVFFLEDRRIPFALAIPTPVPATPPPRPVDTPAPTALPSNPQPTHPLAPNPGAQNPYGVRPVAPVPGAPVTNPQ